MCFAWIHSGTDCPKTQKVLRLQGAKFHILENKSTSIFCELQDLATKLLTQVYISGVSLWKPFGEQKQWAYHTEPINTFIPVIPSEQKHNWKTFWRYTLVLARYKERVHRRQNHALFSQKTAKNSVFWSRNWRKASQGWQCFGLQTPRCRPVWSIGAMQCTGTQAGVMRRHCWDEIFTNEAQKRHGCTEEGGGINRCGFAGVQFCCVHLDDSEMSPFLLDPCVNQLTNLCSTRGVNEE